MLDMLWAEVGQMVAAIAAAGLDDEEEDDDYEQELDDMLDELLSRRSTFSAFNAWHQLDPYS